MSTTKQEIARESIDAILQDNIGNDFLPVESNTNLPAFSATTPANYTDMKNKSVNKAKRLMNSLLTFYLSEELIDKNEYISARAKIEMGTMANLIQQMEISERAITLLMTDIDGGNTSPRMFEVLAGLQRTLLDIMKHQTLQILATEESMKKLKRDIDIYEDDKNPTNKKKIISVGSGNVIKGSRDLMKEIQEELGDENSNNTEKNSEFDD